MIRSLFAGFVFATLPVFASAAVLTVEYATSVSAAYNWGTGKMQAIEPITGLGSFTYDLDNPTAQYLGSSVRAVFPEQSNMLGLSSPGIANVPFDPRADLYRTSNQLFAAVQDSPWSLSMTLMAALNAFRYDAASASRVDYNWRLYWTDDGLGQGAGDGSSAYLLSTQDVVDAYRNLVLSGAAVTVQEGFSFSGGGAISGLNWTDQNARITRVFLDGKDVMLAAASVPTPATYALLLPGLMLIGATTRRRKAASGVARCS